MLFTGICIIRHFDLLYKFEFIRFWGIFWLPTWNIIYAQFRFLFEILFIDYISLWAPTYPFWLCFFYNFLLNRNKSSCIRLIRVWVLLHDFSRFQPVVKFIDHYSFTIWTELFYWGFVTFTSLLAIILEY
jgi:hypothetical protein